MKVYVLVVSFHHGENTEILGVYTDENVANAELETHLNTSLSNSGYLQETDLIDIKL